MKSSDKKQKIKTVLIITLSAYKRCLTKKQDAFLDAYSEYLHNKDIFTKGVLERKKIELEIVDPNFKFKID